MHSSRHHLVKSKQIIKSDNESDISLSNKNKKRWAVTIVAALFLLVLYRVIFGFSAQDSEQSGNLSLKVSEKCVEIVNNMTHRNWTSVVRMELAEFWEHPIRKLAHFTEYTCMGLLVYTMWRPWRDRTQVLYRIAAIWVFLSAAFDELHQYFVPGRYCSFADVLLDTAGGIFGICICVFIEKKIIAKISQHILS